MRKKKIRNPASRDITPTSDYQSASDLFGQYRILPRSKSSERATLLGSFAEKTGMEIGQIAFMLGHLKDLRDLYFIKSDIDQAHSRGVPYSAAFRKALKPNAEK